MCNQGIPSEWEYKWGGLRTRVSCSRFRALQFNRRFNPSGNMKKRSKRSMIPSDSSETMRDVLSDVEAKQFKEASVANGYKRLREAFLDAEDFFDRVENHKKQLDSDHRKLNKLCRFFKGSNPVKYAIEMHNGIKKNVKNLNAIAQDLHKFGLSERTITEARRVPATYSFVNTDNIIGRDDDKRKVIDLLLGFSADQEKIPIVSIVGIGGMGKTTLAQLVYNDESGLESGLFNLKLWVSDSGKFDVKLLLQKILSCISPDDTSLHNLGQEQLQNRLIREIKGKKYLLVLDDVRNEIRKNWLELEELVNHGNKGSRILVTTRSRKVATVMGSASPYELKGLSTSDSWQLFENMAFGGSKDENLIEIGNFIVKKCSQVPLAIKTIGCLLFGEGKRKWERVRDIDFAKIEEESNDLMPILKISYDDLEPTLKHCFQYCALLPKNAIISREILSCIWMANDCVKTNECQAAEDVCDDNLKILHNRCFLEEVERNKWGDVTHFRMHDLMHDLAKEVAGTEMFVVDSGAMGGSANNLVLEENVRHMNLKSTVEIVDRISTVEPKNTRLRTLLHHDVFTWRNPWHKLLSIEKMMSEYRVLRMLDLEKWRIESLSNSIGELIHLRYLNLSYNEFKTLPDSVVELCNLQSLLLKSCTNLKELPKDTRKLINLRHLNLEGCYALTHMPSGMGALTSLRTLNSFIVGPQKSKDSAKLEDLEPLSNLQGDLMIKLSEKITLEKPSDGGAFLLNKRLKMLKIEWPSCRSGVNLENDMDIFGKLQPHSDLEDFTIYGYESLKFPLWVPMDDLASVLPNLISIIIDQCTRCRHLPSFRKLRCLKHLTLCNLSSLEYIEENVSDALFFPSLDYLWLMELPELKGWCRQLAIEANDSGQEQFSLLPPFPHLSDLYIYGCPCLKMTSMPLSSIREFSLKSEDEDVFTLKEAKTSGPSHGVDVEKKDSEAAHASCEFHTNDTNLLLSIPWEEYLQRYRSGKPVSLEMKVLIGFDIQATNMTEPFRRMSNHLFYLEIHNSSTPCMFSEDNLTAKRELFIKQHMPGEIQSTLVGSLVIKQSSTSLEVSQDVESPWKGLQCLQHLRLSHLPKMERLPEGIQLLTSLQKLYIGNCHNLTGSCGELPWKGLQSLEELNLSQLPKMKRLPEGIQFLTSLRLLRIEFCNNLTGPSGELPWKGLQSLEKLSLLALRKMERLPEGIQFLTSLRLLHIEFCDNLTGPCSELPWKWLQSLEQLTLYRLPKMERLPEGIQFLTSLQELRIKDCDNLTGPCGELPWKGLQSLKELDLIRLPKMERLPGGIQFLTSLRKLDISSCDNFTSPCGELPWKGLQCLQHLRLNHLPKIERLPEGIQFLTSLQKLFIHDCDNMIGPCGELSWKGLQSLKTLSLINLPKMGRLPEGIQFLTSLQMFSIWRCDNLTVPCGELPWKGLQSLEELSLRALPKMERLPDGIQFLTSLQKLRIYDGDNLTIPEWVHKTFEKRFRGDDFFRRVKREENGVTEAPTSFFLFNECISGETIYY